MNPNEVHKSLIKKALLNIGTKYNRIELKEIAEYTHADLDLIVHVIKEMIKGEEIHADYFSTTKSVVFNLEANIDEIDELMLKFEEWEGKKIDKKE